MTSVKKHFLRFWACLLVFSLVVDPVVASSLSPSWSYIFPHHRSVSFFNRQALIQPPVADRPGAYWLWTRLGQETGALGPRTRVPRITVAPLDAFLWAVALVALNNLFPSESAVLLAAFPFFNEKIDRQWVENEIAQRFKLKSFAIADRPYLLRDKKNRLYLLFRQSLFEPLIKIGKVWIYRTFVVSQEGAIEPLTLHRTTPDHPSEFEIYQGIKRHWIQPHETRVSWTPNRESPVRKQLEWKIKNYVAGDTLTIYAVAENLASFKKALPQLRRQLTTAGFKILIKEPYSITAVKLPVKEKKKSSLPPADKLFMLALAATLAGSVDILWPGAVNSILTLSLLVLGMAGEFGDPLPFRSREQQIRHELQPFEDEVHRAQAQLDTALGGIPAALAMGNAAHDLEKRRVSDAKARLHQAIRNLELKKAELTHRFPDLKKTIAAVVVPIHQQTRDYETVHADVLKIPFHQLLKNESRDLADVAPWLTPEMTFEYVLTRLASEGQHLPKLYENMLMHRVRTEAAVLAASGMRIVGIPRSEARLLREEAHTYQYVHSPQVQEIHFQDDAHARLFFMERGLGDHSNELFIRPVRSTGNEPTVVRDPIGDIKRQLKEKLGKRKPSTPSGEGQKFLGSPGFTHEDVRMVLLQLEQTGKAPFILPDFELQEMARFIKSYIRDPRNPRARIIRDHTGTRDLYLLHDALAWLENPQLIALNGHTYHVEIYALQESPINYNGKWNWAFREWASPKQPGLPSKIKIYIPDPLGYEEDPKKLASLIHGLIEYVILPQQKDIPFNQRHLLAYKLEAVMGGHIVPIEETFKVVLPARHDREKQLDPDVADRLRSEKKRQQAVDHIDEVFINSEGDATYFKHIAQALWSREQPRDRRRTDKKSPPILIEARPIDVVAQKATLHWLRQKNAAEEPFITIWDRFTSESLLLPLFWVFQAAEEGLIVLNPDKDKLIWAHHERMLELGSGFKSVVKIPVMGEIPIRLIFGDTLYLVGMIQGRTRLRPYFLRPDSSTPRHILDLNEELYFGRHQGSYRDADLTGSPHGAIKFTRENGQIWARIRTFDENTLLVRWTLPPPTSIGEGSNVTLSMFGAGQWSEMARIGRSLFKDLLGVMGGRPRGRRWMLSAA